MNCLQNLDNNLKSIVKVVKKILGFLALIVSASAVLSIVFIGSYQKSYCDYWNIDTQLINVSGNFDMYNIGIIAFGLVLVVVSFGFLIYIPRTIKFKPKSIIGAIITWLISFFAFCSGIWCVFRGVITSGEVLINYKGEIVEFSIIGFGFLSCMIIVPLIVSRRLINKFGEFVVSKISTKFVFPKYCCIFIVCIIIVFALSIIGGQIGESTAGLKRDFYVYTETYSEIGDDGETYNLDRVFVLVYSDGEKGIFESAVYEGQNSNQFYKYPKVRINTNEQIILSLEDLPLRRELFNRYSNSDLLEYQR